jgi:hypothetical protein
VCVAKVPVFVPVRLRGISRISWRGQQVGDAEHIKVFANADAAETWLEENDPEGEYEILE